MNNKKIPRKIEVVITGKYNGYNDFFEKNKTKIYSGILECFELLSTSNRKTIKYVVAASTVSELVGSVDFITEFLFRKSDFNILTDFVLDHFEFIEDYEKCQKIIDIKKVLTNSNKSDKLEITNV